MRPSRIPSRAGHAVHQNFPVAAGRQQSRPCRRCDSRSSAAMRSSAWVMRLRTADAAETACRIASRRCSCWRSTSTSDAAAAAASCWRCCNSCWAAATSALADSSVARLVSNSCCRRVACSSVLAVSACAPAERASSSAQRSSLVRRRAAARSRSSARVFSFSRFSWPSRSMA